MCDAGLYEVCFGLLVPTYELWAAVFCKKAVKLAWRNDATTSCAAGQADGLTHGTIGGEASHDNNDSEETQTEKLTGHLRHSLTFL